MGLSKFLQSTFSLAIAIVIGVVLVRLVPEDKQNLFEKLSNWQSGIRHISEAPVARPNEIEANDALAISTEFRVDPHLTGVLFQAEQTTVTLELSLFEGASPLKDFRINRTLADSDSELILKIKTHTEIPDARGKIAVIVGGRSINSDYGLKGDSIDSNGSIKLNELSKMLKSLTDGDHKLSVVWQEEAAAGQPEPKPLFSEPITVSVDTRGPVLVGSPYLLGDPALGVTLVLDFEKADLDEKSVLEPGNYKIRKGLTSGNFVEEDAFKNLSPNSFTFRGNQVRIYLGRVLTGTYQIALNEPTNSQAPLENAIKDRFGNSLEGGTVIRAFTSLPGPEKGKHIQFPEFLPTKRQPETERKINPGDRVETTIVRLFYLRDAHRIAQIVNRTVRSLNRAAVIQTRRRAEDSRDLADSMTDERRAKEREAVRAAEDLRRVENQIVEAQNAQRGLFDLREELLEKKAQRTQLREDLGLPPVDEKKDVAEESGTSPGPVDPETPVDGVATTSRLRRLPAISANYFQEEPSDPETPTIPAIDQERLKQLNSEIKALESEVRKLEQLSKGSVSAINELERHAAALRERAVTTNEESIQAQAREDRAREKQFRLEVTAAHEDPDTYAAAITDSVDPVAQVSVSVIGEGVLQLRGPRKGIDKIRTMVHQMDAPVGQVKVEIVTVQLNGERGNRMERPLGRIEAHLGLGRFLTSQSLMLLRHSIQEVATEIAMTNDQGGHYQIDRDRKYLYHFFGRDFIDELYEMDSEFLRTENKLLSLHSMDIVSQHQAFFVLALARNDVRHMILERFMGKVRGDLVQAEFDYRRSAELFPHKTRSWLPHHKRQWREECSLDGVAYNNQQRYHFRNLLTFFGQLECSSTTASGDTMSPVQREFIRLAQIFKARLINEMELKQRIIERTLIEDEREADLAAEEEARNSIRQQVLKQTREVQSKRLDASSLVENTAMDFSKALIEAVETSRITSKVVSELATKLESLEEMSRKAYQSEQAYKKALKLGSFKLEPAQRVSLREELSVYDYNLVEDLRRWSHQLWQISPETTEPVNKKETYRHIQKELNGIENSITRLEKKGEKIEDTDLILTARGLGNKLRSVTRLIKEQAEFTKTYYTQLELLSNLFLEAASISQFDFRKATVAFDKLRKLVDLLPAKYQNLISEAHKAYAAINSYHRANEGLKTNEFFLTQTRHSLEQRKLLDFLIEEQEQKVIDMLEGTRAQIATVDNYLKRLAIALEDDFKLQFYDPAFVRIRKAAREWDVTLSQVERTSVLTNNRAFAKVTPQATMEFDLPKRNIAVVEALDGAKALVEDYGALLQDPTFLAAAQLQGLNVPNGQVQNVMPGLPSSLDEQQMGITPKTDNQSGSALQSLVPDPSVYKFETGTGYEIRPVIQPDGHSIIYDFNYMYTTNVREPVRADEKHLGRVKRHFINTQVQTSSYELREVSRYQVALKAARTSQGVPLLQDIPVLGIAFRPLPSAESSIQQNIILASTVVYPTLYDLMGLRWAPSVVDLDHVGVRDAEHVVRGRNISVADSVFDHTTRRVDEIMGTERETPDHFRPDLYHRKRKPSPYHPGGYIYEKLPAHQDPTGNGFEVPDRRPIEMRQPPYDRRYRRPVQYESVPIPESTEMIQPLKLLPAMD